MEQMQQVIKETDSCFIHFPVNGLAVCRFNHFQIPGREFVPEQFVNSHQRFTQTVLAEQISHFGSHFILLGLKPAYCQF